jgi:hypothetical protein
MNEQTNERIGTEVFNSEYIEQEKFTVKIKK